MNYYIYQVPGQLKSETLATNQTVEEVEADFNHGEYGIRQVSEAEYQEEVAYNNSSANPWNR